MNVPLLSDSRGVVTIPDVLWEVLALDNVFLELLLPVMQGGRWDYPFPEGQEIVRGGERSALPGHDHSAIGSAGR